MIHTMKFTRERYVPELKGDIELEHLHRYLMATEVATGKIVLDIASGEGYGSAILAKVAEKVFGVDVSVDSVSHAREHYQEQNIEFIVGSCDRIPLPNSSVDLVVSYETIEHHEKHEEMIREIKRVLRPGGALIISSPDKYNYSVYPNYNNPYHVKELFEKEFKLLLENNFKHCQFYRQKVVRGSVIYPEGIGSNFLNYYHDGKCIKSDENLNNPIYWVAYVSDWENTCPAHGLYESTYYDADRDGQIAALNLRLRKTEIESYKAQFRLSCQLRQKDQAIATKDHAIATKDHAIATKEQTIAALYSSRSMRLTRPLRVALQLGRRVQLAISLSGPAIKRGGGLLMTVRKAARLYQMYGFEGIKRGFRAVAASEQKAG
jgi:SAM-dependent methyltransferase